MKITIVVPYRRRAEHLLQFVPFMEHFLAGTECRILVAEQADDKPFNKGALLNVGISIIREDTSWAVLHDVDMLPADSSCDYSAPPAVRHIAGALEQYAYQLPYVNYLGGVLTTTVDAFASVNGYSNRYWGWGSEDDDFLVRLWAHRLPFERRAGRYRSLAHPRAPAAVENMRLICEVLNAVAVAPDGSASIDARTFRRTPLDDYHRRPLAERIFENDGLSSLSYRLVGMRTLAHALPFREKISPLHEIVSVTL